jgi:hypothetical protein
VHEVGRREPERLFVRAGLDHDRLPVRDAEIDDDRVAPTAYRRHRSELEVRIVGPEILFRRELDRVPAATVNLSQLAQVEPRRGREDYADVAPGVLTTSVFAKSSGETPSACASARALSVCAWGRSS